MKIIICILLIVLAYLLDKKFINTKLFKNYRERKQSVPNCKENLYNQYAVPAKNQNLFNKIIRGCSDLLNYNKTCKDEYFTIGKFKTNLWIYLEEETSSLFWESLYSRNVKQEIPAYISMCFDVIIKKNQNNMNIYILTDTLINNLLTSNCPFNWHDHKINKKLKLDYLKYFLLFHYGGIWLKPSTIVFKNFDIFTEKLNTNDIITIGCEPENTNCNEFKILGSRKGAPIIEDLLNSISQKLKMYINDYTFINYDILFLKNSVISYSKYHFNQEYNGTIDINDRQITYENLLSNNDTYFKNNDNLIFLEVDNTLISKYHYYKWFLRLDKQQILESDVWISKLLKNDSFF